MNVPTSQRCIVVYRPEPKGPPEYVGPFVSERLAQEFVNDLPLETHAKIAPLVSRQDATHH